MAKRPTKQPPRVAEDAIQRAVVLLVTLRSRGDVLLTLENHSEGPLDEAEAIAAIDEAARRINLAAASHYECELGTAKTRLADLYQQAMTCGDCKTALAIQKELNKLHALHAKGHAESSAAESDHSALEQLAAARGYLAPLVDAADDEPLDEIARRVVALFTSK